MCEYCEKQKVINPTTTEQIGGFELSIEEYKDGFFYLRSGRGLVRRINFCPVCGEKLTPFDNINTN
jgi:hypothetical protein